MVWSTIKVCCIHACITCMQHACLAQQECPADQTSGAPERSKARMLPAITHHATQSRLRQSLSACSHVTPALFLDTFIKPSQALAEVTSARKTTLPSLEVPMHAWPQGLQHSSCQLIWIYSTCLYYNVCYTCPSLSVPCVLRKVLRRSETWVKTGACVANIVIQVRQLFF